ncbi:hypothetical protein ACRAWF_36725 [Streptomyces sp. L7]
MLARLLTAWAGFRHAPEVVARARDGDPRRDRRTAPSHSIPISALIFGEPGVANDEAVIDLRKDLRLPAALSATRLNHESAPVES